MRLQSADGKSCIEIVRNAEGVHSSFTVRSEIEIGHGSFTAENGDVHFLELATFAEALDHFIMERDLSPQLEGTYGTYIKVSKARDMNSVVLAFAIGDAYCGFPVTSVFKLEGSFVIEQEDLNALVDGFRSLHDA